MPRELSTGLIEKQFTLPLRRFIERYLLHGPNMEMVRPATIDPIDAQIIAAIDSKEELCHIQYTDFDGETLPLPRLWWINAWKTHYINEQLKREKSKEERKEYNLLKENTERMMTAMSKQTGIEREHFRKLAYTVAKRKIDSMAEKFNTQIDKG